jgi:putative lipoic acid-binding regulatory protein
LEEARQKVRIVPMLLSLFRASRALTLVKNVSCCTRVNKYPIQRSFTGIGPGDSKFRHSILQAVESVVGPVHVECMSERSSSKGAYLSVTVSLCHPSCMFVKAGLTFNPTCRRASSHTLLCSYLLLHNMLILEY